MKKNSSGRSVRIAVANENCPFAARANKATPAERGDVLAGVLPGILIKARENEGKTEEKRRRVGKCFVYLSCASRAAVTRAINLRVKLIYISSALRCRLQRRETDLRSGFHSASNRQ